MTKFNDALTMFQYFVNEYLKPGELVLVLGYYHQELKNMIEFIDSEVFFVKETMEPGIDLTSNYKNLPFEDESFDVVINLSGFNFDYSFLKKEGNLFIEYDKVKDFYKNYSGISKLLYNLGEIDYIVLKK